jgi:hypothetical protein
MSDAATLPAALERQPIATGTAARGATDLAAAVHRAPDAGSSRIGTLVVKGGLGSRALSSFRA